MLGWGGERRGLPSQTKSREAGQVSQVDHEQPGGTGLEAVWSWTVPKAWGHQGGGTTPLPREAGQAPGCCPGSDRQCCFNPTLPRVGAPSTARPCLVSYQGDPHRAPETLAPYSRVLGSPRSSCSSGDVLGEQSNLVSTLSPQICSCWPL